MHATQKSMGAHRQDLVFNSLPTLGCLCKVFENVFAVKNKERVDPAFPEIDTGTHRLDSRDLSYAGDM